MLAEEVEDELCSHFGSLKIDTSKRTIVGIADTEGVPHRKKRRTELWDMAFIFKFIVDEDTFEVIDDNLFHTCHFTSSKQNTEVKEPLRTNLSTMKFLKEYYECDNICAAFWNAPHDIAVLRNYGLDTEIDSYVDLLALARSKFKPPPPSFQLSKLASDYKCEVDPHTGLGDVLRILHVMKKYNFADPVTWKPFQLQSSKPPVDTRIYHRKIHANDIIPKSILKVLRGRRL